jgi:hypothetical protein
VRVSDTVSRAMERLKLWSDVLATHGARNALMRVSQNSVKSRATKTQDVTAKAIQTTDTHQPHLNAGDRTYEAYLTRLHNRRVGIQRESRIRQSRSSGKFSGAMRSSIGHRRTILQISSRRYLKSESHGAFRIKLRAGAKHLLTAPGHPAHLAPAKR